ncbi:Disease resistance protein RPV1, partial [Cucurbita argyrosperma subsp. sororia]
MRESSSTSYHVFLSFRGEDTRTNFTSHLVMALQQKCVNVFIDDKLERGEQISESLFRSIEGALISIVILSENYASSSWCLDELVKIIECKKSKDQKVLPIFYYVDPSTIRKQTETFGEALAKHQAEFKTKIQIWREALTTAANLSGWHLRPRYGRNEADFIQDIVKQVLWNYDVFLSFRGEDTRSNFTNHLELALRQKGVNVFIDDKLNRGEQISDSLFRSIEGAMISIVIFSENYVSSS